MVNYQIQPSTLQGSFTVPSSKSHTLRAILFAALAKGKSRIEQFLNSPDTQAMIQAVSQMGAKVKINGTTLEIEGFAGMPKPAADVIQCGNAGQVLRFIGALSGLLPQYTILTGDLSIRTNRPVKPLLDGLNQLGAFATSSLGNDLAPILIKGPLTYGHATIDGADSQPVSGLIIASAFAPHPIELQIINPGEKPWVDLTLYWLRHLNIPYKRHEHHYYRLEGNAQVDAFNYCVPGDFSSAAFPIAAALITGSEVTLHNIDLNDCQGDKAIISLLEQMGARFRIDSESKTLTVQRGYELTGMKIDINDCIDALPILAVVGCFAKGTTEIFNGAIAREKESNRISAISCELKKMGADIEERPDGVVVQRSSLRGATLNTYCDHRLALSLSVAALAAKTPSTILEVDCIKKTYSNFYADFKACNARIEQ